MSADRPAQLILPREAEWGRDFDVARAANAYLATVPAAEREKSDAYFEGGYWIEAWGTLIAVLLAWLLLRVRFAARLRDRAARRGRGWLLQALVVAAGVLLAFAILTLPWTIYTEYIREHQYDLSNYSMGGYLREWAINVALSTVFGGLVITGIYATIRRVRERWIYWATAVTGFFVLFVTLIEPVFIAPIFNDYRSLPPGEMRNSILTLAHETGISADDVYWFDASKQTKRISANVAGLAGTTRIALNDNLMNGTTLPEIRAVMGHEMGHYKLNHGLWLTLAFALAFGFGYWVIHRMFGRFQRRYGDPWDVRDLSDPAGLPLAMAIFAVVMYLLTPFTNSIVRTAESQADAFGLDAAREPHGFASVSMRLSTYRKLDPSPIEEVIFYDHPSGRARVSRAMNWLADHPPETFPRAANQ